MRDRLLPVIMLAIMTTAFPAWAEQAAPGVKTQLAAADGPMTAAILPGSNREARVSALPRPLSVADAEIYKRAFQLQAQGQTAAADRELGRVKDELLKGHVLAQRLLASGAKAKLPELRAWLADYSDLPQAEAVYRLAAASKGARGLHAPARSGSLKGTGIDTEADTAMWEEAAFNIEDSSPKVRAFKARLRQALRDDESAKAEAMLTSAEAQSLSALEFDRLRLMVAADHFAGGRDDKAAALALASAERSGEQLTGAHWISGLALWRQGQPEQARRHFEAAANAPEGQDWQSAAGAFWAARANLVVKRPEAVNHWLEVAATYPRTFYGMLARAELGYANQFSWDTPPFTEGDAEMLMRVPSARRALALLQLGERSAAEDELRRLYPSASKALRQSMLVLAYAGQMPALAVRMGGSLPRENGRVHDAAAFPVPDWTPKGGWQVDKALVYALVRQESSFNPSARSGAGAVGLMQLMPATAASVAGGKLSRDRLTDPEVNLGLGQRYVSKLLAEEPVSGNLMMMAAAYNAGPGNLARWLQAIRHGGDPLLFVESLPSRETRVFTQRVMTSYWVYQSRMGQSAESLDALASGGWPLYSGQDPQPVSTRR
ncbi:murein transglycosylase [Paramagnetospirillum marisnigri]|uniref:Murein transglycosylase n=1 Tax=Paramagnetospirillum marisnigri TaxID=1285242 RepID=A0A178MQP1_9PROT|nr:lytic transglycosylase domain-containing protein [Paramagnetospirillum marisnigri]OAN50264.1 murein transglycosylase [Paramagnetospirillum marisnigri]